MVVRMPTPSGGVHLVTGPSTGDRVRTMIALPVPEYISRWLSTPAGIITTLERSPAPAFVP